ncbi:MAG: hypothetical protein QOF76_5390 [Solirubrobacteraceae bacterium]|jgi:hypothetical protein|nr:hypothetical protein [Solirubrobacteraceae bacterium]
MTEPPRPLRDAARLARFGVTASVETAQWGVGTAVRATRYVVGSAVSGASPAALADEARRQVREAVGGNPRPDEPVSPAIADHSPRSGGGRSTEPMTAAQMFDALLDASADVDYRHAGHPAYVRLLNELAPDEARILRLFARQGPQPAIDVRTKRIFGVGSRLLAPGITMIGAYAGLADQSRVPAYLNNLHRLGLIWFSREMVPDEEVYHLLEAQPEVLEAFKGRKIDIVMRSIELTTFGRDLCEQCGLLLAA